MEIDYIKLTLSDILKWASMVNSDLEGGYSAEERRVASEILYATAGDAPWSQDA